MTNTQETRTMTPIGLQMAAATYLEGTQLLELIDGVTVETDGNGKIVPHVIRNVRMTLKVAAERTPDDIVADKCQKFRAFLADYVDEEEAVAKSD